MFRHLTNYESSHHFLEYFVPIPLYAWNVYFYAHYLHFMMEFITNLEIKNWNILSSSWSHVILYWSRKIEFQWPSSVDDVILKFKLQPMFVKWHKQHWHFYFYFLWGGTDFCYFKHFVKSTWDWCLWVECWLGGLDYKAVRFQKRPELYNSMSWSYTKIYWLIKI